MPQLYVKDNGVWKVALEIYIKDQSTWKLLNELYIKNNNVWKKVYPDSPGKIIYDQPGSYNFIVPAGVTSLNVSIYGAGGGSGASNSNGDAWVGSGGGAGGIHLGNISVTPNEILDLTVGLRGYGASYHFNSSYSYNPNNQYLGIGTSGGSSLIKRGLNILASATGGGGGRGLNDGTAGGSPGLPSVPGTTPRGGGADGQGEQGSSPGYSGYGYNGPRFGGRNGTGIPPSGTNRGTGYGNGGGQAGLGVGVDGQDGLIIIEW